LLLDNRMNPQREIVHATPTLIVSRVWDEKAHLDPARRGAYVLLLPGQIPEIVLDGLATPREQAQARQRCERELETSLHLAQMAGADRELEGQRRLVVRVEKGLVITRAVDAVAHKDPARRGAYLVRAPGRLPEIVLDGLASEAEQQAAERRCRQVLEREEHAAAATTRLKELLQERRRSGGSRPPALAPVSRPSEPALSRPIGERLVAAGLVSDRAVREALARQRDLPAEAPVRRLCSLLVEAKVLSAGQAARALGEARGIEPVAATTPRVDAPLLPLFPLQALVELQAAPLSLAGSTLLLAMCDPHLLDVVATLQALTQYTLRPLQATQAQVQRLLASMRGRSVVRSGPPPARARSR
jgi:hypothetical protein